MRRLLSVVAILGLAASGFAFRTEPAPVEVPASLAPANSTAAACSFLIDRSGGGVLDLASTRPGEAVLHAVAAGRTGEEVHAEIDGAGGGGVGLGELSHGGTSGLLVELPTSEAAAALTQLRTVGVATAPCTRPGTSTLVVPGGSTRSGERLELRLVNPYVVDAEVEVASASESGIDSASELESVVVPARSLVTRELAQLLPLRSSLSVTVRVGSGAVHAFLSEEGQGDRMLLEGVEPAPEWWLPVPELAGAPARLVIASPSPVDAEVEVDAFGADGPVEGALSDTVPAEGLLEVPLEEVGEAVTALRVFSTAPVAAALVFEQEGVRAGGPGLSEIATGWLVPGVTAGTSGNLWLFNPADVPAEASLQPLAEGARSESIEVPPASVVAYPADLVGSGYGVRASSPIAVAYTIAAEDGVGLGAGTPLGELDG